MAVDFTVGTPDFYKLGSSIRSVVPMTLVGWGFTTNTSTEACVLAVGDDTTTSHEFALFVDGTSGEVRAMARSTASAAAVKATITTSVWEHYAAKYISNVSRFAYLNGVVGTENTTSRTVAGTFDETGIGVRITGTSVNTWDGFLAHVAAYDVALDDAEIASLAAGTSPLLIRPQSLIFYCPLVNTTAQELVAGVTLTASGVPTNAAGPPVMWPSMQEIELFSVGGLTLPGFHGANRGIMRGINRGVG